MMSNGEGAAGTWAVKATVDGGKTEAVGFQSLRPRSYDDTEQPGGKE